MARLLLVPLASLIVLMAGCCFGEQAASSAGNGVSAALPPPADSAGATAASPAESRIVFVPATPPEIPPLAPYVPRAVPGELLAQAEPHLKGERDEETRAREEFVGGLPLEQKKALFYHLLADVPRADNNRPPPAKKREDDRKLHLFMRGLKPWSTPQLLEMTDVLMTAFRHGDPSVRLRAYDNAGTIGMYQQGALALDPRAAALIDALVKVARSKSYAEAERVAALEGIALFYERPTPWIHQLATLLGDGSRDIRQAAAAAMQKCGSAAVVYINEMIAQYDLSLEKLDDDAPREIGGDFLVGPALEINSAIWIMYETHWSPERPGLLLLQHLKSDPKTCNYFVPYLPGTPKVADGLLALPPQLDAYGWEVPNWICEHGEGDRRFIRPLLAVLREDLRSRHSAGFYSQYLAKALIAVGRGDRELADSLRAMQKELPWSYGHLCLGWVLSEVTGDPESLADAMIDSLERVQKMPEKTRKESLAAMRYDVFDAVAHLDPSQLPRFEPYRQLLDELVPSDGQTNPVGHFLFTGDTERVFIWARGDLQKTARSNTVSYFLEYTVFDLGAVAAPLVDEMLPLLDSDDRHDGHNVCTALVAVGPTPQTQPLVERFIELAGKFKPACRVAPAMALWSCCNRPEEALKILLPLLHDQGWGTTHAAWALGQMGRDALPALPYLKALAESRNAAYAKWAGESVRQIEAELKRPDDVATLYGELGSDEYLVSIRALRRLVAMGRPVAAELERLMAADEKPQLPGRRVRQQARARQVLELLLPQ